MAGVSAVKPIHVLYTVPFFSQECEGTYARFHDVIHTLQRMDEPPWRFSIVPLMRYRGPAADNVYFTPGQPLVKLVRYLRHIARLSHHADIVHVVEGHFPFSLLTTLVVRPGAPMVVGPNLTVGTTPELIARYLDVSNQSVGRWRLKPAFWRHSSNKIVFHRRSPLVKRFARLLVFKGYRDVGITLGGMDADRLVAIPSGVRSDLFCPQGDRVDLDAAFSILYVGDARRASLKGFDVLLLAAQQLVRDGLDFRIFIVGKESPEATAMIQQYAVADHVVQVGFVPRGRLAPYYRSADVTVCPSRYEMDVTTAIESLACGTPVVGSDLPGINRTLGFRPGDANDLARRLRHLHEHRHTYRQQVLAETDRWDIRHVIACFQQVYEEVLNNARSR